jgi:outer membrane protein assembly factor BamC
MNRSTFYHYVLGSVLAATALTLVAGCSGTLEESLDSVLPGSEPKYKSSKRTPPLEIPPDLSSASIGDSYPVPESPEDGSTTYSEYANGGNRTVSIQNSVLPQLDNVRIERSGGERWLVVNAPPEQVWPRVRDFWLEQGFLIQKEDPSVGIMETDWAEERDQFKGGLFSFMRLSKMLYSAATRDKFRTRLERGAEPGTTEVFVSHRGAEEVLPEDRTRPKENETDMPKVWQPRPADPELEAEMLQRMLVAFGMEKERAGQIVLQTPDTRDRARLVQDENGGTALSLEENFSRAWRRTGLALDRVGFTVQDRDRSRGLYFVRYVDPDSDINGEKKEGFFSKLKFWGDETRDTSKDEYLISVAGGREGDNTTEVMVLNKEGQPEKSDTADRILSLLHEQLK